MANRAPGTPAKKLAAQRAAKSPAAAATKSHAAPAVAKAKPAAKHQAKAASSPPPVADPAGQPPPGETVADGAAAAPGARPAGGRKAPAYANAEAMAKAQRNISVSEFFAKNRHLLGFDNPRKALLTTVKEAVDNALDACEEAGILPVVEIWIQQLGETHFCVVVQDNGPGIVRQQVPNIFGKLLYGSKFHRLRMSRGQQGIGISAAGMYGLLTTGRPVQITSRTGPRAKAVFCELQIDTRANKPEVIREDVVEWDVPHGTRVQVELEARYQAGRQSVDDYLQQTAIANPHVTIIYHAPDGRVDRYEAPHRHLPATPKTIRPHPHGIELGVLIKMLQTSRARSVQQFLTSEFSRVSPRLAQEIIAKAGIRSNAAVGSTGGEEAKAIYQAIAATKIMAPATDCVVPIGQEQMIAGLKQVVSAAFYAASTRSPAVYRGNPFIIEAALAFGKPEAQEPAAPAEAPPAEAGEAPAPVSPEAGDQEEDEAGEQAKLVRFANRVPLLYQQSACATYKATASLNWRSYGLPQSRGALPVGPLTIVVHMASVWVPFTSESKEAIAAYPEILKEIRLALQECGRQLGTHIRKTVRLRQELKKRSYIEKYIPAIGEALRDILELKDRQVSQLCSDLKTVLERSRKF
jgi:DNA topoisomerase-6 subunit B